jgi:cytidine deaminase
MNRSDTPDWDVLLTSARAILQRAYAPYSKFQVGAAVLTESGHVYAGCNVENLSYGLTCCAERSAIATAIGAEGPGLRLRAVAVVSEPELPCSPCGACRQVLLEFGRDALVRYRGEDGPVTRSVEELLPDAFASF